MKPLSFRVSTLLAAAALALAGCSKTGAPAKADAASGATRPALTVQTVRAEQGQVPLQLTASGNIAAWQDVVVGSQSNGLRVTELRANVGDWVRKGQVLAVFAGDSVQADVLQARASLLEAEAQAADAQSNASRAHSIAGTGALSTQQINQFNTAAKAANARVAAARAALSNQQLRQGYTRVLAPDDGVISARSATVGAVVPAGTELFRMVRQGRLEWRAEVPGNDLAGIHVGDAARVTTADGTPIDGRVRSIAPTLDPQKRVALVYVDLPGAWQKGAKAGMYVSGTFALGQASGWLVPQSAVVARDGFNYVFAVTPEGRVLQRKVELGTRAGDRVQIASGVDGSLPLVAAGGGFLNDGDLVQVVQGPPPASTAAAASAVSPAASTPSTTAAAARAVSAAVAASAAAPVPAPAVAASR